MGLHTHVHASALFVMMQTIYKVGLATLLCLMKLSVRTIAVSSSSHIVVMIRPGEYG
jgi:hypothetical protein